MSSPWPSPRQWLVAVATIVVSCAGAILVVAAIGVVDVSATSGHAPLVEPFLRLAMHRSVAWHSRDVEEPAHADADLVALGAVHYSSGCAHCHGYPGGREDPIYTAMLPPPPSLEAHIGEFDRRELFRIVRHGLKYAGMPAWSGEGRDDEVWAVVLFLERLPGLDPESYARLIRGDARADVPRSQLSPPGTVGGTVALRLALCVRCHDSAGGGPASSHVPRLGGQSPIYLEAALRHFRDGARESGFMEPVSFDLADSEIAALAGYYAGLDAPAAPVPVADERIERGRAIATAGIPGSDVPACDACHADDRLAGYPRLAGLAAEYQIAQLALWRNGGRVGTGAGRTMAVIAARLRDDEAEAVAAFYESQA